MSGLALAALALAELIAEPFERFLKLPSPSPRPSPADEALTFGLEAIGPDRADPWTAVLAVSLNGSDAPAVIAAAGVELRRIDAPDIAAQPSVGGASGGPVRSGRSKRPTLSRRRHP